MHQKTKFEIIMKFAVSYAVVILLVFIIQLIFISIIMGAYESKSISILETAIQNEIDEISQTLVHIESVAQSVSQNSTLKNFFVEDMPDSFKYDEILGFKEALASYGTDNPYIKDICVQNNNADMLIDLTAIYGKIIRFYQTKVFSPTLSAEELYNNSITAYDYDEVGLCQFNHEGSAVPFVMPLSAYRQKNSSVIIYIDIDKVLSGINQLIVDNDGGAFLITNKRGGILAQKGNINELRIDDFSFDEILPNRLQKTRIDGRDQYVFTGKLARSELSYVFFLSKNQVFGDVSFYRYISVIINFLALLVGFLFVFYITIKKSRSYVELIEIMGIGKPEISLYDNTFKEILPYVKKMKSESDNYFRVESEETLKELLLGNGNDTEKIKETVKKCGLPLEGPYYGVMVVDCKNKRDSIDFSRNFREFMQYEIQNVFPDMCIFFENRNNMVFVFSTDFTGTEFNDFVYLLVAKLESDVFLKCNISATFGVGEPAGSLDELPVAYKQAHDVISYANLAETNEIMYSFLPSDEDYYYPIEMERDLFENALEGNLTGVKIVLGKIKEENFSKRKLSLKSINELLSELRASINKICQHKSIDYEFYDSFDSVKHFFEYAMNFFYAICVETKEEEPLNKSLQVCKKIQQCILENYQNTDISLNWLAERFNLNASYISAMFKRHLGFTWSAYLESIRLEKAIQLMVKERLSVKEAAQQTGFASEGTFRRSFKRNYGVSPSEWIKSKK